MDLMQTQDQKALLAHQRGMQLKQIGEAKSTVMTTYRSIKVGYNQEEYLQDIKSSRLRVIMSRFRCGQHGLQVQLGRQTKPWVPHCDRKCTCCESGSVEDEHHFLFDCPLYADLRGKAKFASLIWFPAIAIGSTRVFLNYNDSTSVASYIDESMNKRSQYMNCPDQ